MAENSPTSSGGDLFAERRGRNKENARKARKNETARYRVNPNDDLDLISFGSIYGDRAFNSNDDPHYRGWRATNLPDFEPPTAPGSSDRVADVNTRDNHYLIVHTSKPIRTDFRYDPLGPTEFRILTLHPGVSEDSIRGDLVLRDPKTNRAYSALSYVWDDTELWETMVLNGLAFSIRRNLAGALRRLRKPNETTIIWVDALCINQNDQGEKAGHVELMSDIYRRGQETIVWLGDESESSSVAFRAIRRSCFERFDWQALSLACEQCYRVKKACSFQDLGRKKADKCDQCTETQSNCRPRLRFDELSLTERDALSDLLDILWRERVRVILAAAMSTCAKVVYGSQSMTFATFVYMLLTYCLRSTNVGATANVNGHPDLVMLPLVVETELNNSGFISSANSFPIESCSLRLLNEDAEDMDSFSVFLSTRQAFARFRRHVAQGFAAVLLANSINELTKLGRNALQRKSYTFYESSLGTSFHLYMLDLTDEAHQIPEFSVSQVICGYMNKILHLSGVQLGLNTAKRRRDFESLAVQNLYRIPQILQRPKGELNENDLHSSENGGYTDRFEDDPLLQSVQTVRPLLMDTEEYAKLKGTIMDFGIRDEETGPSTDTQAVVSSHHDRAEDQERSSSPSVDSIATIQAWQEDATIGVSSILPQTALYSFEYQQLSHQKDVEDQDDILWQRIPEDDDQILQSVLSNRVKVAIESIFSEELVWWPLLDPLRPKPNSMDRFAAECVCGETIYVDVPRNLGTAEERDNTNTTNAPIEKLTNSPPLLPTYHQPQSNSQSGKSSSSQSQSIQAVGGTASPSLGASGSSQPATTGVSSGRITPTLPPGEFVYWCVGPEDSDIQAIEICAKPLADQAFLGVLLDHFRRVFGNWRSWLMMTECKGVIFSKFEYLEDDGDVVVFMGTALPDSRDYDYIRQTSCSLEEVRRRLEAVVKHNLHRHAKNSRWWRRPKGSHPSQNLLLPRIPKKRPPRLTQLTETEGYGMQAVAGLAVHRIVTVFVIWHSGSIVFLTYWLCVHKDDLQNAIVPLTTTLAGFVIYLAILDRFVKR